jgi:hypothetical protein
MPMPGNPIGRRQVLRALAVVPVLASPLNRPVRQERPASPGATDAAVSDAHLRRSPDARQALIGVL